MSEGLIEIIDYEPHCKEHGLMDRENVRYTCSKCEAACTEINKYF